MKRIEIFVLFVIAVSICQAAWFNPAWTYKKLITIDATKVENSTLTNFPVLIDITDADLISKAQADGDDILFTAANGSTQLDHEIESFNAATGHLVAWVRIPSLSYQTDTSIYLYYGNAVASNQQNPNDVWDADYKAIWHLNNPGPSALDSSGNGNTGTDTNGVTFGATGQIDTSNDFDGTDDYLDFGDVLDMGTNDRTASAWFKTSSTVGAIFGKSLLGNIMGRWTVVYEEGSLWAVWQGNDGFKVLELTGTSSYADGEWHNVTIVYDRNGDMTAYMDGALHSQIDISESPLADMDTNHLFYIGRYQNSDGTGPHSSYIFDGSIDEVRISDTIRSADWIATEYNNQSSPQTFIKEIGNESLPVELSSFTAVTTSDMFVKLQWVTQSETNVSGYYVYRGRDNDLATAIEISEMIIAANSSNVQYYAFTDHELSESATYYYWLLAQDMDGSSVYHGPTTVYYDNNSNPGAPGIPIVSGLQTVFPNPFNPSLTINYGLSKAARVDVVIYNLRGQIIRTFKEGQKAAGNWKLSWNGKDDKGKDCSSGIYYIRMSAGGQTYMNKAVLMK
ncbi:MAG: DUF2341 domain-containing protein [Candidatus Cloacimonetes bacterium]|nr:DUF2341 domain-containing protein [Candidatus Cloacimonadota bacterium]